MPYACYEAVTPLIYKTLCKKYENECKKKMLEWFMGTTTARALFAPVSIEQFSQMYVIAQGKVTF
jgi:hypothetical protein